MDGISYLSTGAAFRNHPPWSMMHFTEDLGDPSAPQPQPSDVRYTLYCRTPEVSDGKVHCRTPGDGEDGVYIWEHLWLVV